MVEDAPTIVDVLCARSSSQDPAYIFLADGTAASELRWTYADTATRVSRIRGLAFAVGVYAADHASCWR